MAKTPIVAIVGRANAGKSSIFNRLVQRQQAIVAREAGTTRDAVYGRIEYNNRECIVVDTAGLKSPSDSFEASIQEQIRDAAGVANAIVVVVDGSSIVSDEDRAVAKLAHKSKQPVILAVNKSDIGRKLDVIQFQALGIKTIVSTSAAQNHGITELIEQIFACVSTKPVDRSAVKVHSLALIGRPNVGKSSLFNALAKKQQAVVADSAGTTRDVNRIEITYHKQTIRLLDTAGIRKSGKIQHGIERFSVMRAIAAIEEADVCVLVIDATEPGVALDQKLAGVIKDAGKGLILCVTKWDLVKKDSFTHDQLIASLKQDFQHVPWAVFTVASAMTGQNISRLLELMSVIMTERNKFIKTSVLNKWLQKAVDHHPPAGFRRVQPKLRYSTQTGTNPPVVTIFGSGVRVLHWSYKRFLEKSLRETFGFDGTPIHFQFVERVSRGQAS